MVKWSGDMKSGKWGVMISIRVQLFEIKERYWIVRDIFLHFPCSTSKKLEDIRRTLKQLDSQVMETTRLRKRRTMYSSSVLATLRMLHPRVSIHVVSYDLCSSHVLWAEVSSD
jgi:hypothetical protein